MEEKVNIAEILKDKPQGTKLYDLLRNIDVKLDEVHITNPHIDYTNQMLIINPDGRADSWVPSSSDVFAEDWEVATD